MLAFFNQVVGNNVRVTTHLRHQVFYPGNVVEGFVEVQVSAPTPFRAIRVRLCGKEYVHVERHQQVPEYTPPGEPQRYRDIVIKHESKHAIYNRLVTLAGSMKTAPTAYESVLPPGTFYYPFAFQLPRHLPASFSRKISDDSAEIQYYVKAYVDIPSGRDGVHRALFRVLRPLPISQYAQAAPFNFAHTFDVTCCCCISKGKVGIRLFMNRTIIALDRDTLQVFCDVDNTMGEEPVESLHISLSNDLSYSAEGMTENHRLDAGSQTLKGTVIPAGGKGQIMGTVPLDRNALPTIRTSNIQSNYVLTATVNIPWASDPEQNINVIVAQTVDESNWAEQVVWNENPFQPLPPHRHSEPEAFYQPPPNPAFQYTPPPVAPPMQPYQPVSYQFQMPPYGVPNQQWQSTGMVVSGQPYQATQPQQPVMWQQGCGQAH